MSTATPPPVPDQVADAATSAASTAATEGDEAVGVAIRVPHFVLFANRASKLTDSYMRYLEKVIRDEWSAPGVPFKMSVRGQGPQKER